MLVGSDSGIDFDCRTSAIDCSADLHSSAYEPVADNSVPGCRRTEEDSQSILDT